MADAGGAKKKKGMSLDEKRDTIMKIMYESKDVFNLKDLEKLGSKAGVVLQTVKDVVQSLVDDHLIDTDKIGAGNFYWAFVSNSLVKLQTRNADLQAAIDADGATTAEMEAKIAELTKGREETAVRMAQMAELEALRTEQAALEAELKAYAESDPDALRELQAKAVRAKEAATRWTDNVWTLKSYLVNNFGKTPSEVDALLGIPEDFDYPA